MVFVVKIHACPNFKFHITFTGTQTFYIEDINNSSSNLLVTGTGSIDAWNFNSSLANPCGLTFAANICYQIKCAVGTSNAEAITIKFNGNDPVNLVVNYNVISETFTVTNIGNASAYTIHWGDVGDNPPTCSNCNSDVVIMDNYLFQDNTQLYPAPGILPTIFTTLLTESGTFITIKNSTIPMGADVKLDANPANGFVMLYPGFSTLLGANFLAQPLDGCGPLIPH